jgi:hypothetical protein
MCPCVATWPRCPCPSRGPRWAMCQRLKVRSVFQVDVPWGSNFPAYNIMEMELRILAKLHWRLNGTTAVGFLDRLLDLVRRAHPGLPMFNTPPPPGTPGANASRTPEAVLKSVRSQARRIVCMSLSGNVQFMPGHLCLVKRLGKCVVYMH